VWIGTFTFPATEYVELPTWSVELHGPLIWNKTEVNRSDVGGVVEIVGGFGEVVRNWGARTTEEGLKVH